MSAEEEYEAAETHVEEDVEDDEPADMAEILASIDRYNPGNLSLFLEAVREQCQESEYDLDVLLAVLKLYQFNPEYFDEVTAKTVLLKSLTAMPQNDFSLCLSLLSDEQLQSETIQAVMHVAEMLELCDFAAFWAFVNDNIDFLNCKIRYSRGDDEEEGEQAEMVEEPVVLRNFHQSIRSYVAHVVNITYQHVDRRVVKEMLGDVQDSELERFAELHGWKIEGDSIFVSKKDASIKSKEVVDEIPFKNLVGLIASSQGR